jgi:DnaJ-class molecular chaperone
MPIFGTKNRSNLIISIIAEMPEKITNEIKEDLNKISKSIKKSNK